MKRLTPLLMLWATSFAQAATTTHAEGSLSSAFSLLQVALSLLVILVLIMGMAWFAKRYLSSHTSTNTAIKMISGLNVGGRERVLLLEVGEQWVVIGVAPGHISTLTTMPRQPVTTHHPNETRQTFSAAMSARFKQMREAGRE
ncbi:MAG: flagellar biosynthetic protein FliO [Betaproteobacteria bacterium]|nr:flagellar biosynthetic protein FliO [Betaproteobacteria bacterium]